MGLFELSSDILLDIFILFLALLSNNSGNVTFGYTTLWRNHFGTARFIVALFDVTHFVAGPCWSRPFWCKFHENNFFFWLFFFQFFIFLIYIIFSVFFFFHFFQNSRRFFVYF